VAARPLRLGALLAAVLLPACTSSGPPPIRSHVALFRVDTSALEGRDLEKEDAVAKAVLHQCIDGRLSARLHTAIEAQCGAGSTALLPKAFAKNLDYAWDQDPAPDVAIVARLTPRAGSSEDKVTGAIVGSVGWFLIGVPGYFVDDHEERPPLALEISLYEGVERSERDLGDFEIGADSISTNFIDRNGASVLPYVCTLLIPPYFVSKWSDDDPDAVAELLLESIVKTAAEGVSARIRAWEHESGGAHAGG
jgi:hypothetical protein